MFTCKDFRKVESLEEAWQLNQKKSNLLIGGMLWKKMGSRNYQTVIDLSGLGLDQIEETETEYRIGCMTTLHQLEINESLNQYTAGAVRECVRHIVGVQFRNCATVGGSIFGRFGFSDVLTMFLAMDTQVELYKGGIVSLKEFNEMKRDRDILVRLIVKKTPGSFSYQNMRNARTDFPILAVGASCMNGTVQISVGARPAKAMLLSDETGILAKEITEETAKAFGEWAAGQIPVGGNMRGSAEYRKELVKVLTRRAVLELAKGGSV